MPKFLFLCGKKFLVLQELALQLPDSFVLNKRGSGAGEAKLYVGAVSDKKIDIFFKNLKEKNCLLLRSDFERYLSDTSIYTLFNFQSSEYNRMKSIDECIAALKQMQEEMYFSLDTYSDSLRRYVRSEKDKTVFEYIRFFGINKLSSLKIYKLQLTSESERSNYLYYFQLCREKKENATIENENHPILVVGKNINFLPSQIIYYGVPGCGKSHQIKEDLKKKNISQDRTKRVVFHPDYCNADFIGQIMPETKKDGGIRYNFKAGPFTQILRKAYENPTLEYALIIEEINRGNAASIFGDVFQLLDRKTKGEQREKVNNNVYDIGWSDYCISNDYINAYFRGAYDGEEIEGALPERKLGNVTFNDNVDIRLPPNLSIYATMNTSDQNVFTLDNAFQRRWKMKQISNSLDLTDPKQEAQYNLEIKGTGVKWGKFREEINKKIVDPEYTSNFSSLEDKRLGGWFIVPEKDGDTTISKEDFADKVIKFLWDDAFKFNRTIFGDFEKDSLENVIAEFINGKGFDLFEENFRNLLKTNNAEKATVTQGEALVDGQ